jgi:subfamily B ATP-binding cassette protein MsbA
LGLVLPLVVRNLVDFVFINKDFVDLNRVTVALVVVFIFQSLLPSSNRWLWPTSAKARRGRHSHRCHTHLQELPLSFYAERRTGELVSRLTNDVALLQQSITWNLVILLRQVITIIGASALLFWLDWRLTLLILLVVPVITLTMVYLGGRIRAASIGVQDALAEVSNVAEETTRGVRIVKSFARETYEVGRFSAAVMRLYNAAMHRARTNALLAPIIGLIASITITGILYYGGSQVILGRLTPGDLIAYLIYTVLIASPVAIMADLYGQFQAAIGASQRMLDLLDTPLELSDAPDASLCRLWSAMWSSIASRSTTRPPSMSSRCLIRGAGWAAHRPGRAERRGKSAGHLIPRFYDVVAGCVTIDGHNVRDDSAQLARADRYRAPGDAALSGTVYDNIRYGRLEASRKRSRRRDGGQCPSLHR